MSAHPFSIGKFGRVQFFRTFFSKITEDKSRGIYHRCMVMGQNFKEQDALKETQAHLSAVGYDRWVVGDLTNKRK